jgi:prophage DNA circulation protein
MTWREDLRRVTIDGKQLVGASFRGVPFLVETVEVSTGRRIVVHEFPLRNDPFVEDLGRRARRFRVDGYVIGDDYLAKKNALLTALEAEGPGELVIPYYDVRRAIGDTVGVRETRADGGMAVFALEFTETPTQAPVPTEDVDSASEVATSADAAVVAAKAELAEQYDPAGLPAFALASAETALRNAAAGLGDKLAPVVSRTQEFATLTGQLALITARASSLVREPDDVLDAFRAAITGLAGAILDAPGAVLDALTDAYSVDLGPDAPTTTATRERERANQIALTGALRRVFAIEAARIAPLVPYASIEEATAARDRVAAQLEEQAAGAGDTAYPALVTLRSDVLRAVPGAAAFARVVTVTRRVAIPSLLLTYQIYGSVDREADVIARNGIRNPGFVVGDLKVLSV